MTSKAEVSPPSPRTQQLKAWVEEDSQILQQQALSHAIMYPYIIVPTPEVLVSTIRILARLLLITNKVFPIRSFFAVTQEMQESAYLRFRLASERVAAHIEQLKAQGQTIDVDDPEVREWAAGAIKELSDSFEEVPLQGIYDEMLNLFMQRSAKRPTKQECQAYVNALKQASGAAKATAEVFLLACSFVGALVGKQDSIVYIDGEAFDFKETKARRVPLNLAVKSNFKIIIKALANDEQSALSDDDEPAGKGRAGRGQHKANQVLTGINHIIRRSNLDMKRDAVYAYMTTKLESTGKLPKPPDVRAKFGFKPPEHTLMLNMLQHEGRLPETHRRRSMGPRFDIKKEHRNRIQAQADALEISFDHMLEKIIEAFFSYMDVERRNESAIRRKQSNQRKAQDE